MVQDIILKADCHSARQKISHFLTETEGSSPCSQKPATGPYPEPAEPAEIKLTSWSRAPLEKLIETQSRNSVTFMEKPTIGSYYESI
jgi:hypothetical protein